LKPALTYFGSNEKEVQPSQRLICANCRVSDGVKLNYKSEVPEKQPEKDHEYSQKPGILDKTFLE